MAPTIWDALFEAGSNLDVRAGCPNLIERIEGGLLSYGNDMTIENSPYECGLEKFCDLTRVKYCIGQDALEAEIKMGIKQIIRYIEIDGTPVSSCLVPWPVYKDNKNIGQVTSAAFSPSSKTNVSIGMIDTDFCDEGRNVTVIVNDTKRTTIVHEKPFV